MVRKYTKKNLKKKNFKNKKILGGEFFLTAISITGIISLSHFISGLTTMFNYSTLYNILNSIQAIFIYNTVSNISYTIMIVTNIIMMVLKIAKGLMKKKELKISMDDPEIVDKYKHYFIESWNTFWLTIREGIKGGFQYVGYTAILDYGGIDVKGFLQLIEERKEFYNFMKEMMDGEDDDDDVGNTSEYIKDYIKKMMDNLKPEDSDIQEDNMEIKMDPKMLGNLFEYSKKYTETNILKEILSYLNELIKRLSKGLNLNMYKGLFTGDYEDKYKSYFNVYKDLILNKLIDFNRVCNEEKYKEDPMTFLNYIKDELDKIILVEGEAILKTVEGEDVEDNAIILKKIDTVDGDVLIINTNENKNIKKNNKKYLGHSNHTRYLQKSSPRYSPKYSPRFSRYPRYKNRV